MLHYYQDMITNDTNSKPKPKAIEVCGRKGMNSTPFRKTFKSQEAFERWLDKNEGNVSIDGIRDAEEN